METRHKIPMFPNSVIIYQFGIDSSTAYSGTNKCSLYMGLLGYQANTIVGLIVNNTTKFTIMDGNNSIDQTSWNIDTFNGSGLSWETLTFSNNNYTFFMIFANGNNNEDILFGFYINGVPHVCHKTPIQNQTVTNTRKTRGTLIYYANSFTGNVGAFGSIYSIKLMNTQGHLGNISARMIINLNVGVATVFQSWSTSTSKKTLMAITLNSTFANTNLAFWPLNFMFNGVITAGGKMMCEMFYVNNDTYTFSGGTYSTSTPSSSIGSIFDIYYNFTVEPTVSGLSLQVALDNAPNFNLLNAFTNSFQLLGQTATNNTKTMLVIQVTPLNSTTCSLYGSVNLGYF